MNTRPRLSGVNVNSSAPPNGLDGESASRPFITSMAAATLDVFSNMSTGATNRCERRPSFQVSQWRNSSES